MGIEFAISKASSSEPTGFRSILYTGVFAILSTVKLFEKFYHDPAPSISLPATSIYTPLVEPIPSVESITPLEPITPVYVGPSSILLYGAVVCGAVVAAGVALVLRRSARLSGQGVAAPPPPAPPIPDASGGNVPDEDIDDDAEDDAEDDDYEDDDDDNDNDDDDDDDDDDYEDDEDDEDPPPPPEEEPDDEGLPNLRGLHFVSFLLISIAYIALSVKMWAAYQKNIAEQAPFVEYVIPELSLPSPSPSRVSPPAPAPTCARRPLRLVARPPAPPPRRVTPKPIHSVAPKHLPRRTVHFSSLSSIRAAPTPSPKLMNILPYSAQVWDIVYTVFLGLFIAINLGLWIQMLMEERIVRYIRRVTCVQDMRIHLFLRCFGLQPSLHSATFSATVEAEKPLKAPSMVDTVEVAPASPLPDLVLLKPVEATIPEPINFEDTSILVNEVEAETSPVTEFPAKTETTIVCGIAEVVREPDTLLVTETLVEAENTIISSVEESTKLLPEQAEESVSLHDEAKDCCVEATAEPTPDVEDVDGVVSNVENESPFEPDSEVTTATPDEDPVDQVSCDVAADADISIEVAPNMDIAAADDDFAVKEISPIEEETIVETPPAPPCDDVFSHTKTSSDPASPEVVFILHNDQARNPNDNKAFFTLLRRRVENQPSTRPKAPVADENIPVPIIKNKPVAPYIRYSTTLGLYPSFRQPSVLQATAKSSVNKSIIYPTARPVEADPLAIKTNLNPTVAPFVPPVRSLSMPLKSELEILNAFTPKIPPVSLKNAFVPSKKRLDNATGAPPAFWTPPSSSTPVEIRVPMPKRKRLRTKKNKIRSASAVVAGSREGEGEEGVDIVPSRPRAVSEGGDVVS